MIAIEKLRQARLMMPNATMASVEILASSGLIEMLAEFPLPPCVERSKSGHVHNDVTGYFQRTKVARGRRRRP